MKIVEACLGLLGRSKKPLSMDELLAKAKSGREVIAIIKSEQEKARLEYQAKTPARIAARIAARTTPATAKDYRVLAENYLDPLGKDRRGAGDYSPDELANAVGAMALHFAKEEGAPEEVLREITGERK